MRTSNPTLNNSAFQTPQSWQSVGDGALAKVMTMQGTVNKTALLLGMCVTTATVAWYGIKDGGWNPAITTFGGAIAALIACLVACFKPQTSPVTAPIYALSEGFFVGGISLMYAAFTGDRAVETSGGKSSVFSNLNTDLVLSAAVLSFSILGAMLAAYSFKIIRPGRVFNAIVITGTMGVCLYGLVAIVASMLGFKNLLSVYDPNNNGIVSIGFSLFVVALASLNFVLDFDTISNGVKNRAPRYMEWYGGMGILVTLVWLYVELLRLLAKLRPRD